MTPRSSVLTPRVRAHPTCAQWHVHCLSRFAHTEVPEVARLSPLVTMVLGLNPGPFTLTGTNTYLVGSGAKRILIDTGEGKPEYVAHLAKQLEANRCTIQEVLITHHHMDHIGGIQSLQEHLGAPLRVHKYRASDAAWEDGVGDSFEGADISTIADGQTFSCEGATLKALFTPGHTTDHVSFLLEEEKSVFTGDCILGAGSAVFQDLASYMASLQRLKGVGASRLYPGHGPVIDDAQERIETYIAHRLARDKQVCDVLAANGADGETGGARGMSSDGIAKAMYVAEGVPDHLLAAASRVVLLHLVKMEREGAVARVAGAADDAADDGAGAGTGAGTSTNATGAGALGTATSEGGSTEEMRALLRGADTTTQWHLAGSKL